MEKIIKTLSVLKEDNLNMVHKIIKILAGRNRGGTDLNSLLSADGDGILTQSEQISFNDIDDDLIDNENENECKKIILLTYMI